MPWAGDPRTSTPEWRRTRKRILARDRHTCACGNPATIVDHVINVKAGGSPADSNLQAICDPCHKKKTNAEAAAARAALPRRQRPPERHPGLR